MAHKMTLTLDDPVYEQLCSQAKASDKPITKIALEALANAIVKNESDISKALNSDEELWQIAQSHFSPSKQRRFSQLIEKHEAGESLTSPEKRELERLIEENEWLAAVKSEAYMLLKQRGHQLPTFEGMQHSTPEGT